MSLSCQLSPIRRKIDEIEHSIEDEYDEEENDYPTDEDFSDEEEENDSK